MKSSGFCRIFARAGNRRKATDLTNIFFIDKKFALPDNQNDTCRVGT